MESASADIYLRGKRIEKGMSFRYVSMLEELLLIEQRVLESDLPSEDKLKILDILGRVKAEVLNEIFRGEGYGALGEGISEEESPALV